MIARRRRLARAREVLLRLGQQLPLLLLLIPLWMLLWGEVSWLSLTSGVVVAFFVSLVFYLPPAELSDRLNPFWLVVFLVRFLVDVVIGSCQVAWIAFRPRGVRGNAIVAAPLATRSDLVMTAVAIVMTLIPGSVVIEIDRARAVLYLHAIDVAGREEGDRLRAKARSIERGIVRAIGSREDLEAVR